MPRAVIAVAMKESTHCSTPPDRARENVLLGVIFRRNLPAANCAGRLQLLLLCKECRFQNFELYRQRQGEALLEEIRLGRGRRLAGAVAKEVALAGAEQLKARVRMHRGRSRRWSSRSSRL